MDTKKNLAAESAMDAGPVGKIPSGLYVITSLAGTKMEGYLGSWVQQASFSPLLISITIHPGRPCYDSIKSEGRFCLNIVGHKNGGMMKPFWNPSTGDPFKDMDYFISARGNVVLRNAVASLECELRASVTPGDHEVIFAEVVETHTHQPDDKPLTHVRKTGLEY